LVLKKQIWPNYKANMTTMRVNDSRAQRSSRAEMTSKTESFILDEEGMRDVSHSLVSMLVEISTPFKNDTAAGHFSVFQPGMVEPTSNILLKLIFIMLFKS